MPETRTEILECGHPPSPHESFTPGFGRDSKGNRMCYPCCAEEDRRQMRAEGKIGLYLTGKEGEWTLVNWPGSLKITPYRARIGGHNIAGRRVTVWFNFEGSEWIGVLYGENTQVCHCKRLKG
jgi:hypothetical protein